MITDRVIPSFQGTSHRVSRWNYSSLDSNYGNNRHCKEPCLPAVLREVLWYYRYHRMYTSASVFTVYQCRNVVRAHSHWIFAAQAWRLTRREKEVAIDKRKVMSLSRTIPVLSLLLNSRYIRISTTRSVARGHTRWIEEWLMGTATRGID